MSASFPIYKIVISISILGLFFVVGGFLLVINAEPGSMLYQIKINSLETRFYIKSATPTATAESHLLLLERRITEINKLISTSAPSVLAQEQLAKAIAAHTTALLEALNNSERSSLRHSEIIALNHELMIKLHVVTMLTNEHVSLATLHTELISIQEEAAEIFNERIKRFVDEASAGQVSIFMNDWLEKLLAFIEQGELDNHTEARIETDLATATQAVIEEDIYTAMTTISSTLIEVASIERLGN